MRDILDPGLKGGVGRLGAYGAKSVGKAKKKRGSGSRLVPAPVGVLREQSSAPARTAVAAELHGSPQPRTMRQS